MKVASLSSRRYKARDIRELLGVNKNKLHYWILNGLIEPVENPVGTGTRRVFSLKNLLELALVQWLSINGYGLSYIKEMKAALDKFNPKNKKSDYNIFMDVFENHCNKETLIQFYKIEENYVLFLITRKDDNSEHVYFPSNPWDIKDYDDKYSGKLDLGKMAVNLKKGIKKL